MAAAKPASEAGLTQLTEQLKEQNSNVVKLVKQGEAQIAASEDAARIAAEAAREAARTKDEKPEIAVKVELEEDDEGWSSSVVAAISGAVLGASAGLVVGFLNMWKGIFKFIGGKLSKVFPNISKMLSNTFGKGGTISKFFTSIKTAITENKAFKTISDGFTKFKTTVKSWGASIAKFFKPILDLFKGGVKSGGALGGFTKFKKVFTTFFKVFKTFFAKLFLPLQVIISLFDGFFEAKDAAKKSEGMLATFFNSIIGFFGGILDGLIFGMLDLIKDGISWIAGFLGFKDVEKFLDSFSFSDMFNEFLDDIYEWFNLLFSDPTKALSNLFSGIFGAILNIGDFIWDMIKKPIVWVMELFGWDDAAEATENFSLSGWVMEKWEAVKAWFTGIFNWFKEAGADGEGGWSLWTFVENVWQKVKDWFTGLLSWAKETGDDGTGWSFTTFVSNIWTSIKEWFTKKFSFSSEEVAASKERWKNLGEWVSQKWEDIKDWFSGLFEFEGEDGEKIGLGTKLLNMFKSLIDSIISIIPGFEAVTDASKYWDLMDTGDKNVDTKALQEQVATMSAEDLQKLKESFKEEQESTFGGLENAAAVMGIIASREKALQRHKGGPIKAAGIYKLLPNEMVLDNEATSLLVGVAKTLSGAALADLQRQSGQAQGMGTNVVIQNNNSTQMNSNASTVMPITPIQPSNSEQHYA